MFREVFISYYNRRRREGGPGTPEYEANEILRDLDAAGLTVVRKGDGVSCRIDVMEVGGKLDIKASIPDGAEETVAGALTRALLGASSGIMNAVLGQNKSPVKIDLQ